MSSAAFMREPVAATPPANENVFANAHDLSLAAWFGIILNEFTYTLSTGLKRIFGICNLVKLPR